MEARPFDYSNSGLGGDKERAQVRKTISTDESVSRANSRIYQSLESPERESQGGNAHLEAKLVLYTHSFDLSGTRNGRSQTAVLTGIAEESANSYRDLFIRSRALKIYPLFKRFPGQPVGRVTGLGCRYTWPWTQLEAR
jgi:hypothetical protein